MADATVSKTVGPKGPCEFDPRPRHQVRRSRLRVGAREPWRKPWLSGCREPRRNRGRSGVGARALVLAVQLPAKFREAG